VANHGFSEHRERRLDKVKEQNLVVRVYDDAGNGLHEADLYWGRVATQYWQ
jgi:hypothetical protein